MRTRTIFKARDRTSSWLFKATGPRCVLDSEDDFGQKHLLVAGRVLVGIAIRVTGVMVKVGPTAIRTCR